MDLHYPNDFDAFAKIPDDRKDAFEKWMAELDAEYLKAGSPYGEGPLAKITGIECWIASFDDEMTPADSLHEDMSNAIE